MPEPKIVIAVGACAISGGPYVGHPEIFDGAGGIIPIDLYIPGCPPHPVTILDGILRLLARIEDPNQRKDDIENYGRAVLGEHARRGVDRAMRAMRALGIDLGKR
jgi:NADH:ubiquinone oxidoreductase subunit B-like Fe-S oxidoreductase